MWNQWLTYSYPPPPPPPPSIQHLEVTFPDLPGGTSYFELKQCQVKTHVNPVTRSRLKLPFDSAVADGVSGFHGNNLGRNLGYGHVL